VTRCPFDHISRCSFNSSLSRFAVSQKHRFLCCSFLVFNSSTPPNGCGPTDPQKAWSQTMARIDRDYGDEPYDKQWVSAWLQSSLFVFATQLIVHHLHRGNTSEFWPIDSQSFLQYLDISYLFERLNELAQASVLQVLEQRAWLLPHLEPSPAQAGRQAGQMSVTFDITSWTLVPRNGLLSLPLWSPR
jgi:hypothetical protein